MSASWDGAGEVGSSRAGTTLPVIVGPARLIAAPIVPIVHSRPRKERMIAAGKAANAHPSMGVGVPCARNCFNRYADAEASAAAGRRMRMENK